MQAGSRIALGYVDKASMDIDATWLVWEHSEFGRICGHQ